LAEDLKQEFGTLLPEPPVHPIDRVRAKIRASEAAWATLQTDNPGHPKYTLDKRFQIALVKWLQSHGAMLVGEVVPLTLQFVTSNRALPSIPKFTHVYVDEYQDLNKAEQVLVELLAEQSELTVV